MENRVEFNYGEEINIGDLVSKLDWRRILSASVAVLPQRNKIPHFGPIYYDLWDI